MLYTRSDAGYSIECDPVYGEWGEWTSVAGSITQVRYITPTSPSSQKRTDPEQNVGGRGEGYILLYDWICIYCICGVGAILFPIQCFPIQSCQIRSFLI